LASPAAVEHLVGREGLDAAGLPVDADAGLDPVGVPLDAGLELLVAVVGEPDRPAGKKAAANAT
jgi:hypothetical protein